MVAPILWARVLSARETHAHKIPRFWRGGGIRVFFWGGECRFYFMGARSFLNKISRKGFCRNPRGIFPDKVLGEFCRGFFGGVFRAFFLGKSRSKKSPKNPRQNSNQNLGVSRPKSTLQGSGLDKITFVTRSYLGSTRVARIDPGCPKPNNWLSKLNYCNN